MRQYKRMHVKGKPKWDMSWYKHYREKYIEQIKAIPQNIWLEVRQVVPVHCEVVEQFFGLNGSPMTKYKYMKGTPQTNYRLIRALLCYFNIIPRTSLSKTIQSSIRVIEKKVRQYRIDNQIAKNKQYMADRLGLEHFPENGKYASISSDEIYLVGLSILGCNALHPREEYILRARYGLDSTMITKRNLEMAMQVGVSKQRISQIINYGIRKLRHPSCNPRLTITIPYCQ